MCDFSIEHHASRKARTGDKLVTTSLGEHGTVGLVSPDQPNIAVCLLPGTRLKVRGDVPRHLVSQFSISAGDEATFNKRELPEGQIGYRDGLVFDHMQTGTHILFQDLLEGLQFEVISIPAKQSVAESAPAERVLEDA